MVIFNSYVKLPEGTCDCRSIVNFDIIDGDDVDDGWNLESVDQIGLVEKSERPRAVAGDAQKPPTKPHIMQKLFSMDWLWEKLCRKTMFFTLI